MLIHWKTVISSFARVHFEKTIHFEQTNTVILLQSQTTVHIIVKWEYHFSLREKTCTPSSGMIFFCETLAEVSHSWRKHATLAGLAGSAVKRQDPGQK